MPRGDKSNSTPAQRCKARHIEASYEARAWATVNKQSGGGERPGGGRRTPAKRKAQARRARRDGPSPRRARALTQSRSPHRPPLAPR